MKKWDGKERRKSFDPQILIEQTINKTLTAMGFDMTKPTEIQAHILHLRKSYEVCNLLKSKAVVITLGVFITSFLSMAAAGFVIAIDAHKGKDTQVIYQQQSHRIDVEKY